MPTINVARESLFKALGQRFEDEEFDELCFQFGIELDDVTTEAALARKEKSDVEATKGADEVIYKIEIPANRYDLLCLEGLSMSLRQFLGKQDIPTFTTSPAVHKMTVKPETAEIRPFVVCAVLRNISFDKERYNSFIDLQDKLHTNICRKRTLVAIGTHDLDTIEGPFEYRADVPSQIVFKPLNQQKEMNAEELMTYYESDNKLKKFLHIIRSAPRYPVIYDAKGRVLSLPPIINGDHSKISYSTKNVLIECTATDLNKANIVLNTMCTMYAMYCEKPFNVEQVEVTNPNMTPSTQLFPNFNIEPIETSVEYLQRISGVKIEGDEIVRLLRKMSLPSKFDSSAQSVTVFPPPTRTDVLHACDVAEDVAISFGYNNVPLQVPPTRTVGKQQPINRLTDALRAELAMASCTEVLTFALCSHAEAYEMLGRKDDSLAIVLDNPKTVEFEIVRPALLPGLLKSLVHNKSTPLPLKLFEVTDIAVKDASSDVGAKNSRSLGVVYGGLTAGFEIVHGLLDRVMCVLNVKDGEYQLVEGTDPAFFPGRSVDILLRGQKIGVMGILHPSVLQAYDIPHACSALEINVEPFL